MLFAVLISSTVLVWVWNRNAYEDEDAEDLNKLRDKLMKLKRSHFLNKPVNPEDFENGSVEQHVPSHTLDHKKLFNSSLDLSNFAGENCRNTVQGKLLITDERGELCEAMSPCDAMMQCHVAMSRWYNITAMNHKDL